MTQKDLESKTGLQESTGDQFVWLGYWNRRRARGRSKGIFEARMPRIALKGRGIERARGGRPLDTQPEPWPGLSRPSAESSVVRYLLVISAEGDNGVGQSETWFLFLLSTSMGRPSWPGYKVSSFGPFKKRCCRGPPEADRNRKGEVLAWTRDSVELLHIQILELVNLSASGVGGPRNVEIVPGNAARGKTLIFVPWVRAAGY